MDPLATALREISSTRDILDRLIISSESFDYPQAKLALTQLRRKVRDLGKLQAKLQRRQAAEQPNVCVVDFQKRPDPGVESLNR